MSNTSEFYEAISKMPPLRHTVGETFDMEKSEVVAWLMALPQLKQWLFSKISGTGRIVFDEKTGTWSGAPYRQPLRGFKEWNEVARATGARGGRPKKFEDEALLAVMDRPLSVAELAALMNCSRPMMKARLKKLVTEKKVVIHDFPGSPVYERWPAVMVEDVEA